MTATRVKLRTAAIEYGPASTLHAQDALRHSAAELGIVITEPVTTELTDVDEDGVVHLTDRWVIAHAYMMKGP